MKIAVYTCITGRYDPIKTPVVEVPQLPFYCFTDAPEMVTPPWGPVPTKLPDLNAKDKNRYIKMHPHKVLPDYDATLYIDGSIQVVGDLFRMICEALQGDDDIFIYEHPERDCAYEEAVVCSHFGHDWIWNIASQMRRYRREGFPMDFGLFEAGVILRRNNSRLNNLMEFWWQEYIGGVKRDQLSLPYVSWKHNTPITSLGKSDPRFSQRYFSFVDHPSRPRHDVVLRECINRAIARLVPNVLIR